jgi:hypothetical protein
MSDNLTSREIDGLIRSRIEGSRRRYREPAIQLPNTASRYTPVENQSCPHCGRGDILSLQSFNHHVSTCQRRAVENMRRSQQSSALSSSSSASTSIPLSTQSALQYNHPICSPCARPSEAKLRLVNLSINCSSFNCLVCKQTFEYRSSRSVSAHLRYCAIANRNNEERVFELTAGFWPCCLKMKEGHSSSSTSAPAAEAGEAAVGVQQGE